MARTLRRNNRNIIRMHCGTKDELDDWDRKRWPGKNDDEVYLRRVREFTSDHSRGMYGVPRWFRRMQWTGPMRRHGRREIIRCLQKGSWDDHLPPYKKGDDGRYGYYW